MTDSPGETGDAGQLGVGPGEPVREQGWYLYGITRSDGLAQTELNGALGGSDSPDGISNNPLEIISVGPLAAVVQRVRLSDLDVETMQKRSEDAAWLEAVVSAHNRVITHLHERQPILPARFGSIYGHAQEVSEALDQEADDLLGQLDRLEGTDEWAVHVYVDRDRIAIRRDSESRVQQLEEEMAAASPGRAYFLRRQLEEAREAEARHALQTMAEEAFESLSRAAVDAQVSASPRTSQATPAGIEVLRAAFLVPRDEIDTFLRELSRLDAIEGVQTEGTGPWPPYSFSSVSANAP